MLKLTLAGAACITLGTKEYCCPGWTSVAGVPLMDSGDALAAGVALLKQPASKVTQDMDASRHRHITILPSSHAVAPLKVPSLR